MREASGAGAVAPAPCPGGSTSPTPLGAFAGSLDAKAEMRTALGCAGPCGSRATAPLPPRRRVSENPANEIPSAACRLPGRSDRHSNDHSDRRHALPGASQNETTNRARHETADGSRKPLPIDPTAPRKAPCTPPPDPLPPSARTRTGRTDPRPFRVTSRPKTIRLRSEAIGAQDGPDLPTAAPYGIAPETAPRLPSGGTTYLP